MRDNHLYVECGWFCLCVCLHVGGKASSVCVRVDFIITLSIIAALDSPEMEPVSVYSI